MTVLPFGFIKTEILAESWQVVRIQFILQKNYI